MKSAAAMPLRILVVHNRYRIPGGEDSVFANEVELLRAGGQVVEALEVSNADIIGRMGALKTALGTVYNRDGRRLVADAIRRFRPDLVHVHNFFPKISPALFDACAEARVPAVWTLHNFRFACANGLLFRDGKPCEDCLDRLPLPAVRHRCYRSSAIGSAAVAGMIGWHRWRGTWSRKVARFITLNEFGKNLAVRAGLPPYKILVKPNFVADRVPQVERAIAREGALFVGRLSEEKGVRTLLAAWRAVPNIPLKIIGDGPERASLEALAPPNVTFLGHQPSECVTAAMACTKILVVPSEWYETFGMVAAEAMSVGTPVIASRIGSLAALVEHGHCGLLFSPRDADDLSRTVHRAFSDPVMLAAMGKNAHAYWAAHLSPDRNLERLLAIYREAIAR